MIFWYVVGPKGAVFVIAILLQWNCLVMSFSNCLYARSFLKFWKPCELVQAAGYIFIQGTTHALQLLDQSPHAFDGIGVCTTDGVNQVLGVIRR